MTPAHRDVLWPDQWTAVTADGKRSAQFEHTMVVTENGCEVNILLSFNTIFLLDYCLLILFSYSIIGF
jgi:hypothetical protein